MAGYSHSKLSKYESCPQAYKLSHLDKVPAEDNEAGLIGLEVHRMIALYLEKLLKAGVARDTTEAIGIKLEMDHPDVVDLWQGFYSGYSLPEGSTRHMVEHKMAFDKKWKWVDFSSSKARYRGIVDLAYLENRALVVRDWKTGRKIIEDIKAQLLPYALGALVTMPKTEFDRVIVAAEYIRYGRTFQEVVDITEVEAVKDAIDAKIRVIEKDTSFEARPGSFCKLCGVVKYCPAMTKAVEVRAIPEIFTQETAIRAGELLFAIRSVEKELVKALKKWAEANGPVPVGDLVYGPRETPTYSLDPEEMVSRLMRYGVSKSDVWGMLSITAAQIKKKLKRIGMSGILDLVLAEIEPKKVVKYDFRIPGLQEEEVEA